MPLDPSSTALDIPIIAFVSNKGGVTKTTTAAATAVQLAKAGFRVRVADLDAGQDTLTDWHRDRVRLGIEPTLSVQLYRTPADALRDARDYDILILDGPAKASTSTLAISGASTSPCLLSANDDCVSMRQNSMLWPPSACPSCSAWAAFPPEI